MPSMQNAKPAAAIADYGLLSDCHSAALVDRFGSIDWWCVPRFDSASVFGRLLDAEAGHWTLAPTTDYDAERSYLNDTMVLRTTFRTAEGTVSVTDALGLEHGARDHDIGLRSPHVLLRKIEGLAGSVEMHSELAPRMEYGRTQPHLSLTHNGVDARGGPVCLICRGPVAWQCDDTAARTSFQVVEGDSIELTLAYRPSFGVSGDTTPPNVADTIEGWRSWSDQHTSYQGAFAAQVRRSSLVLQGLTYSPRARWWPPRPRRCRRRSARIATTTTGSPGFATSASRSTRCGSPLAPPSRTGSSTGSPTPPGTPATSWCRSCTASRVSGT